MNTITPTIPVQRVAKSRIKETDFNNLEFGKYIADHMVVADFTNGKWQEPTIVPFADISISPAMLSLHYGQSIFEGMKAYRTDQGVVLSLGRIVTRHDAATLVDDADLRHAYLGF